MDRGEVHNMLISVKYMLAYIVRRTLFFFKERENLPEEYPPKC